jgi:hypothetical protein
MIASAAWPPNQGSMSRWKSGGPLRPGESRKQSRDHLVGERRQPRGNLGRLLVLLGAGIGVQVRT